MAADESFAVSLELLRRGRDIHAMVKGMADRLDRAMPEQVKFTASRLRRRTELEIEVLPEQFRIEVVGQRTVAQIDHIVRGVCVRSEEVDIDAWLDRLRVPRGASSNARRCSSGVPQRGALATHVKMRASR